MVEYFDEMGMHETLISRIDHDQFKKTFDELLAIDQICQYTVCNIGVLRYML